MERIDSENLNQWYDSGDSAYILVCSKNPQPFQKPPIGFVYRSDGNTVLTLRIRLGLGMYGLDNGTGTRISILGFGETKVGAFDDLGLYGIFLCYYIPMVLLGLLAGFQPHSHEWIHW